MSWFSISALLNPDRRGGSIFGINFAHSKRAPISVDKAFKNATVYSAVKLITNTVSKMPLRALNNPAIDRILQSPNLLQNGTTFHGDIVHDLLAHGNAFITKSQ